MRSAWLNKGITNGILDLCIASIATRLSPRLLPHINTSLMLRKIATSYGLDGPGIEFRWEARFSATVHRVPGNSSMTAALEGGKWSAARPGRTLPPGKTRYALYRRLGGPQGRSGRAENLVLTGIRYRNVQPGSSVAIPTELPGPQYIHVEREKCLVNSYFDFNNPANVTCKRSLKMYT